MVWVKRPSPVDGVISAKDLDKVIGKKALVDIQPQQQIFWDEIKK